MIWHAQPRMKPMHVCTISRKLQMNKKHFEPLRNALANCINGLTSGAGAGTTAEWIILMLQHFLTNLQPSLVQQLQPLLVGSEHCPERRTEICFFCFRINAQLNVCLTVEVEVVMKHTIVSPCILSRLISISPTRSSFGDDFGITAEKKINHISALLSVSIVFQMIKNSNISYLPWAHCLRTRGTCQWRDYLKKILSLQPSHIYSC